MSLIDSFLLLFAGFLVLLTARVLEATRRAPVPARSEILARFDHQPARFWLAVGALAGADLLLVVLAFIAFGASDRALLGFGAHGWAWGLTLSASAGLVSVVLIAVIRTYVLAAR